MKICSYCNTQNSDAAQFCIFCGRSLNPSAPGPVESYGKKKASFWWNPAAVCFVCAILVAFAIYMNGKKQKLERTSNIYARSEMWQAAWC